MPKKTDSTSEVPLSSDDLEQIVKKALDAAMEVLRTEFAQQLTALASRVDTLETTLNEVMSSVDKLGSEVFTPSGPIVKSEDNEEIKKELDSMRKNIQDIELHANDSEQYSRNNNLRIKGLVVTGREAECRVAVHNFILHQLKCKMELEDIDVAHQIQSSPQSSQSGSSAPSVFVRFKSRSHRDAVTRSRRILKGTRMTIQEDPTPLNVQTVNRLKRSDLVERVWSWNGKIFALLKNGTKILARPFQRIQDCKQI